MAGQDLIAASLQRQAAFQKLRPVCSQLLLHRNDAQQLHEELRQLHRLVSSLEVEGLMGCWDYISFPLLLIIDSAAHCRVPQLQRQQPGPPTTPQPPAEPAVPAAKSDRVCEAVLDVLLALSERVAAHIEADQAVTALQRMAPLLQLAQEGASEEVRARAYQCVGALLSSGQADPQAVNADIGAGGGTGPFGVLEDLDLESLVVDSLADADALTAAASHTAAKPAASTGGSGRSPLSQALIAEVSAPLVGYIVASAIAASDAEVAAGPKGSKMVQLAALHALQALVWTVNDTDALTFFLPGMTTGLCKQILAARAQPAAKGSRTAGAGTGALPVAVEVLTDVVVLVLSDDKIKDVMGTASGGTGAVSAPASGPNQGAQHAAPSTGAEAALAALQQLALGDGAKASGSPAAPGGGSSAGSSASKAPSSTQGAKAKAAPQQGGRLRVERTKEWAHSSCSRVSGLLLQVLPPLAAHPRPSVREALARASTRLLSHCQLCVGPRGRDILMEVVLSLAQDEWPHVAQLATSWLSGEVPDTAAGGERSGAAGRQPSGMTPSTSSTPPSHDQPPGSRSQQQDTNSAGSTHAVEAVSPQLLNTMIEGLTAAVSHGDSAGTLHARKLAAALLHAGVPSVAQHLLTRPARLSALVASLAHCFFYDPAQAAQALHLRTEGGTYVSLPQPAVATPPSPSPSTNAVSATLPLDSARVISSGHSNVAADGGDEEPVPLKQPSVEARASTSAAVQLPRMPLCLLHISSQRCYEAVAGVARTLGHLARLADVQGASGSRTHLRRLCDLLASLLQDAAMHAEVARAGQDEHSAAAEGMHAGSGLLSGAPSWQCGAAAAACLSSEVLYGACALWSPPFPACGEQAGSVKTSGPDASFEASAMLMLQQFVVEALWGVPTSNATSTLNGEDDASHSSRSGSGGESSKGATSTLSAGELGQNALMVRALAEACGAIGWALGPRLAASGRSLRTALIPLLERLANPCGLVASAATTSLTAITHACGYGGSLRTMLSANADYVVDALCAQLRDLDAHPRAPLLLAALLRRAGGVGPELLPRMAEPLAVLLRGLSTLARRRQPHYTLAFLLAASEVAQGAALEAVEAAAIAGEAQAELHERVARLSREREAAVEAAAAAALSAAGKGAPGSATPGEVSRAYFNARAALREQDHPELSGVRFEQGGDEAEAEAGAGALPESWKKGVMGSADIQRMDERFRRLHAAAVAASAAADAAAPLMLSSDLRVAQTAIDVCMSALAALAPSTRAVEADTALYEELGPAGLVGPAPPETPKLLPTVAALWPPLVTALQDARTPLVERSLALLACVTRVGGGAFMARRFQQEAAPVLARLLASGTARAPTAAGSTLGTGRGARAGAAARESAPAPGALQRVRIAALGSLEAVCSCSGAWGAVKGLTWGISQAALPFLASGHGEALQDAAARVLQAVAGVDPDSVWLLLVDVVQTAPDSASPPPTGKSGSSTSCLGAAPATAGSGAAGITLPSTSPSSQNAPAPVWAGLPTQPAGAHFPPLKRLLPTLPPAPLAITHTSPSARQHTPLPPPFFTSPSLPWPVTPALAADCAGKARGLLAALEGRQAPAVHSARLNAQPVSD